MNMKKTTKYILILILAFLSVSCGNSEPETSPLPEDISSTTAETGGDARLGLLVFNDHCFECHSTEEGEAISGPSLFSAGEKFTYDYVKESIQNPHKIVIFVENPQFEDAEMPEDIAAELSNEDFENVIAYVLSQIEAAGVSIEK